MIASTAITPLVAANIDAVVDFFLQVYPSLQDNRAFATRYYTWKYCDLNGRDTGYPAAFVARDDAGLTGFLGTLPFRLRCGDTTFPSGWVCDWYVLPRARGTGIGRALLQAAMEILPALACVDGTPQAQHIFRESGFQSWECARNGLYVSHPFRYEWPRRQGLRRLIGVSRAMQHWYRNARVSPVRDASKVALVPCDIDISRLDQSVRWGMVRDVTYMGWIARCPAASVRIRGVRVQDSIECHVMFATGRDAFGRIRGRILELCPYGTRGEMLWASVARAIARTEDCSYVDTIAPLHVASEWRRAGWETRRPCTLWVKAPRHLSVDATQWTITPVDKDDAFRGFALVP